MTISLFSRTRKHKQIPEVIPKEYVSICGIIDIIEFNSTPKKINGILLDSEGREFEFIVQPNGDLIQLTGLKEDLTFSWNICVDYLKSYYGKKELEDFKRLMNSKMNALQSSIKELNEKIEEIEIPKIISQSQTIPVIEEKIEIDNQPIEKIIDDEDYKEQTFEDFSDEDLASHALKVLNGEIPLGTE